MLFKKRDELDPNKKWYSIGIMTDHGLQDEEYDALIKRIHDSVENVVIISDLVRVEWDEEKLQTLNERFRYPTFSDPCFIINEFKSVDIKRERKLLEKNHKWKRLFGLLSPIEYMVAETKAAHDFDKALYYTDDVDNAIEYLTK
ncbi:MULTISPECIES: hypothetical protein [Peribacillus]|uniref:hypothetical protein n=1 Tax=Peribacillus TaxID=2675229 RepID=UPI0007011D46|nr:MULTISPECIES: hypothetical protein [Peribacillus]KQU19518.1 hypothetical protein ASG65_23590 [Bacillus sp. Leaf13]KRF67097.1 hypothetical protein ASG99_17135 [Bacillus sp. Soil768D1]MBK5485145.1 hypothetical protein [Peribacillus sp. TH16]MED3691191.1 hypothetical protein [Peribacillus butanolivorans]WMX55242.1 hypothetical protein RE409_25000 [Peribacillus sp. R9-11]